MRLSLSSRNTKYYCQAQSPAKAPARLNHFYLKLDQPDRPADQTSTFQSYYDLELKSKVVDINSKTPGMSLDHNPIGHGGHLALF